MMQYIAVYVPYIITHAGLKKLAEDREKWRTKLNVISRPNTGRKKKTTYYNIVYKLYVYLLPIIENDFFFPINNRPISIVSLGINKSNALNFEFFFFKFQTQHSIFGEEKMFRNLSILWIRTRR